MSDETARFGLPLLVPGQGQKDITHNEALVRIDAMLSATVVSRTVASPPAAPQEGQAWLVAAAATGAWAGRDGQLAVATGGGWRFLVMPEGARLYVEQEARALRKQGGTWRADGLAGLPATRLDPPVGGAVVDTEARAVLADLLTRLVAVGLLAS